MSHFNSINLMTVCHQVVMNSKCILNFKFNHIFLLCSELIIKFIHNESAQCTCMYNPQCSLILLNTVHVIRTTISMISVAHTPSLKYMYMVVMYTI